MLVQALVFVLDAIFHLFILAILVRFWMQVVGAPTRNPIAQFSMALTDFIVKPLRRVIPGAFRLDLASLVAALLLEYLLQFLVYLLVGGSPGENPGVFGLLLFFAFVKLVRLSVYVFIGAVFIQALISWVSPHHPVGPFFNAFTRPLLKPFQRAVPPIGGVDITPMLVILLLYLILMLPVAFLEHEALRMMRSL
jgi:YggT family protein